MDPLWQNFLDPCMFIKQNKNSNEALSGSVCAVILRGILGSYIDIFY